MGSDTTALPHLIEAEQQVLGAILLDNDAYTKVSDILEPRHFHEPLHGEIFRVAAEHIGSGRIVTPVTLKPIFEASEALKELGGPAYLVRVASVAPGAGYARELASIIVDLAAKREVLAACERARADIEAGSTPASTVATRLETEVGRVAATTTTRPLVQSHLRGLMSAVSRLNDARMSGAPVGVTTGIEALDRKLGRLRRGQMILLAGRSSMGKTTIAQSIIYSAAKRERTGVFFASLEMTREELSNRFLSLGLYLQNGQRIPYADIAGARIDDEQMRAVVEQARRDEAMPILTGERECRDMPRLRSAARQAQRQLDKVGAELGLVVIDYAQLLVSANAKSIYERVSMASDFIKTLAMDLDVPVLALSQLSREVEKRDPPVPQLSDLRESGKLEEDADVVILTYRESYYLEREVERTSSMEDKAGLLMDLQACRHDVDLIIAKQRNGETGKVRAFIQPEIGWVGNERPVEDGALI